MKLLPQILAFTMAIVMLNLFQFIEMNETRIMFTQGIGFYFIGIQLLLLNKDK